MGKKKSKISKQKQAKAAAKSMKSKVIKEPHQPRNKQADKAVAGKKKGQSEKKDFEKLQASMQERLLAELQQEQRVKKNRGKKFSSFQFTAPTLILEDAKKPTTQLMTEITTKAQGWEGIGNGSSQQQQQQQQLAQAAGSFISLKQVFQNSSLQEKPRQRPLQLNSTNRFAALHADDEDDEDNSSKKPTAKFQFAPATFQFTPASFSMPSSTSNDVDPDL
jgi:hypothetical protein